MNGFLDTSEQEARLLAQFLEQYEQAPDKAVVLRHWSEAQPQRAAQFAALVAAEQVLSRVRPEPEGPPPERLGDFRIVRRIAGGGMGVVYEASQEPFGRRVAVKTIRPRSFSEQARDRFLREQRVLAGLHQTHIVPIYAAGRAGDLDYFAMPYIDGVSVRDLIQELRGSPRADFPSLGELARRLNDLAPHPQPLAPGGRGVGGEGCYFRSVAELLADVAEAIAHAHQQSVIHRDLKPANLMVDVSGHSWVLDFGLAGYHTTAAQADAEQPSSSSEVSTIGARLGTLDYMAPEQLDGGADARTDVWGLGVVLHELLTLQRAFALTEEPTVEGAPLARRRRELAQSLAPLRSPVRHLPEDLAAICRKCLEKQPAARYESARAVADDLRRFLRGEETSARPYPVAERVWRWGRRYPAGAGVLAMAGALLLCVAVVVGYCWELQVSNAHYAHKLAKTVDRQFQLVSQSVRATAANGELARRLGDVQGHPEHMPAFLSQTKKDCDALVDWFKRRDERAPFFNWFVMAPGGDIITDSGNPFTGNYKDRDYARLLDPHAVPTARDAVYISQVFRSEIYQQEYKYAVTARTWDGDQAAGVVAAAIAVDSQLVALDMKDESPGAMVVCPMDWSRRPGHDLPPEPLPRYIVVLHADYTGAGTSARWVGPARVPSLDRFAVDPALSEALEIDYHGGGFVNYARVGGTQFVVLVPRGFPWPIHDVWTYSIRYGSIIALILAGIGVWRFSGRFSTSLKRGRR